MLLNVIKQLIANSSFMTPLMVNVLRRILVPEIVMKGLGLVLITPFMKMFILRTVQVLLITLEMISIFKKLPIDKLVMLILKLSVMEIPIPIVEHYVTMNQAAVSSTTIPMMENALMS